MIAIGIATIPSFARLTRGGALQVLRHRVRAGRPRGGPPAAPRSPSGTCCRTSPACCIVQASVSFAIAVLAEAALSFLGFGTPPPTPSWGRMLQEAQELLFIDAALALWPGLAIALAVLGFNLLGDGLRDRFDPRLDGPPMTLGDLDGDGPATRAGDVLRVDGLDVGTADLTLVADVSLHASPRRAGRADRRVRLRQVAHRARDDGPAARGPARPPARCGWPGVDHDLVGAPRARAWPRVRGAATSRWCSRSR